MKRFQKQLPLQTARKHAKYMLNEEKLLDETGAILENLQQKSLFQFAQKMFASASAQTATELLNMHPLWFTDSVTQPVKQEIVV